MIKKTVTAFREAGIHITMDDYGTGSYSSQMMLELPVEGCLLYTSLCSIINLVEYSFAHAVTLVNPVRPIMRFFLL